jgi:RNA-directed DNA polymerase
LLTLERQLRSGAYRPGHYTVIEINGPKKRLVSAAPLRDRVVHHALCAVVCPIFEAGFIDHSFANRSGKGTHRAIEAYEYYCDQHAHALRADIYRYFPSIDHAILKTAIWRRIMSSGRWIWSTRPSTARIRRSRSISGSPCQRRRGLPIGNLTGQFFANRYLDGFDHFVTEVLQAPYVRYVDDEAWMRFSLASLVLVG